ncbi:hypothetical protein [Actinoplanes sp. NPDC049802]|uniref:hypothetical protein n=1 Tax=Actinoplanes sp. NPDC049802 TaxID=3154742 RepID=UPI0033DF3394
MRSQAPTNRAFLQVAAIAVLVFIGAALVVFSGSLDGIAGLLTYSLLPVAWLTACCSLAGLALASVRH